MKRHLHEDVNYFYSNGAANMVTCPKCGTNVETPMKTLTPPRRAAKSGDKAKMGVGMFLCPDCKTRFRASFGESVEETSIKTVAQNLRGIEGEFVNTLKNLREKMQKLESERSSLLLEIDGLKKAAESKASAIENEITMLRDEVKSLKELLGYQESENE